MIKTESERCNFKGYITFPMKRSKRKASNVKKKWNWNERISSSSFMPCCICCFCLVYPVHVCALAHVISYEFFFLLLFASFCSSSYISYIYRYTTLIHKWRWAYYIFLAVEWNHYIMCVRCAFHISNIFCVYRIVAIVHDVPKYKFIVFLLFILQVNSHFIMCSFVCFNVHFVGSKLWMRPFVPSQLQFVQILQYFVSVT